MLLVQVKQKKKTTRDLATGMSVSIMLSNVVLPICIQAFSYYATFFFRIFVLIKKIKLQTENVNQGKRTLQVSEIIIFKFLTFSSHVTCYDLFLSSV